MRQPLHVALVLLGALLALLPLHLLDGPDTPGLLGALDLLRLAVGTLPVLLLPGLALAPVLLRRDLRDAISLPHLLLAALGLNVAVQFVHLNALRLASLPIGWPSLLALTTAETLGALVLLRRRRPGLRFAPSSPGMKAGLAVLLALLAGGGMVWRGELLRDSSWNYYDPQIEGLDAPLHADSLRYLRIGQAAAGGAQPWEPGRPFTPASATITLRVRNDASFPQTVPLFFLVHGRLGVSATLRTGGQELAEKTIAQLGSFDGIEKPVEQHWMWGSVALAGEALVGPQSEATVTVDLAGLGGALLLTEVTVVEWSGLDSERLIGSMRAQGFRFMPPYQLLNVTENVRWADEVATDYVLSGRSPEGLSTLHQPPGWTYQYAPARLLLTGHLATASALFFVILAGLGLVGLLAAEEVAAAPLSAPLGALIGLGVGATALQHARTMLSDGSMNFPDSLYALALAASVLLLVGGRTQTFLIWAGLATVLRYPGAVVVALAAASLAAVRADLRRKVTLAVMRFGLAVAAFCGVMLLLGVATRSLDTWLFALWFETMPEHFDNNPEAMDFWRRPLEFARLWALLGGGVLVTALPLRTTMGRVAAATALLYAPFLAFIDHFSHHYFLPLLVLCAMAAAAEAAGAPTARERMGRAGAFAALGIGLALWSARQGL